MYIDTHTHIMDERYEGQREDIIGSLTDNQIEYIISIAYDAKSSKQSLEFADKYSNIYGAVGIHPHDSKFATIKDYDNFKGYAENSKIVAIGETGLDYYYDHSPREVQQRVFIEHLELAHSLKLPVILHLRDAYEDMLNVLHQQEKLLEYGGVLHCYSGSSEMAKRYLDLNLYISFSGTVTFKNAKRLLDAVRLVPLDRILTETDCPYLTPEPHRGKLNYPQYVKFVADKVAQIKEIDINELNDNVAKNCKTLFKRIK